MLGGNKKRNSLLTLIAGLVMIIVSVINYYFNEDYVSLGMFLFAGLGFVMMSIAEKQNEKTSKRLKKYSSIFFLASLIILAYWFLAGKLEII